MRVSLKKIILLFIFVFGFFLIFKNGFRKINFTDVEKLYKEYEFFLNTSFEECDFSTDPFDPSISDYIQPPHEPVKCTSKQYNLTFIDGNKLLLTDKTNNKCFYRYFYHNSGVDDFSLKYADWRPLEADGVELDHDFVDVSCKGTLGMETYRYQHATVIPKKVSIESNRTIKDESETNPSVIMLGFDGLSKSNYIRQLPRSKKTMDKMGFILMDKHVKIADNTFPNWVAIFMGQHTYDYEFKGTVDSRTGIDYDNWTEFAWRKFGASDYVTLFAEDSPKIATFNYDGLTKGFIRRPPTDHYLRPLYLAWDDHVLRQRSNVFCYDSDPVHQIQLKYIQSFLNFYEKKAKFVFNWFLEISHDYLNTVGIADEDFEKFLKKNEKKFENSFVIVFSDHGNRYDRIRETVIGRLESRLPLLSIRVPPWFQKKFPNYFQALKENSQVMTSHFDLHATLMHVLEGINGPPPDLPRGQSLFSPVSPKRTCREAEIPKTFCPCNHEVTLNSSEGIRYAEIVLDYIKDYFEKHNVKDKCAPMDLDSVKFLSVSVPPPMLAVNVNEPNLRDLIFNYRVQFTVKSPSNALLEGIVYKNKATGETSVSPDIERNNKYGNTSVCVDDRLLKKLCHCI